MNRRIMELQLYTYNEGSVSVLTTERVGVAVNIWTRNREVLAWNLGRDTGYSAASLAVFLSTSSQMLE
jgi:hypothetical protein